MSAMFNEKIDIRERCKGVHCVDLGESFPTSIYFSTIYLQNLASIQPRTSPIISRFRALGNLSLNFEVSKRLFAAQNKFWQINPPPQPTHFSGLRSRKGYLQNEIPGHVGAWLLFVLFVLCSLDFLFRLIRNIVLFFFSLLVLFCLSKMSGCCSFQRTSRLHCRKENVKHHRIMNITNVKHRVQ